jgi:hypothetical protein
MGLAVRVGSALAGGGVKGALATRVLAWLDLDDGAFRFEALQAPEKSVRVAQRSGSMEW